MCISMMKLGWHNQLICFFRIKDGIGLIIKKNWYG
jgi:hypothetical protein